MRTLDPEDNARFEAAVDAAKQAGDTIGGVAEVIAYDGPVGLGTHVTARERLDARLAAALMSIQSVKGVEIGDGFAQAALLGSAAHDEILRGEDGHLRRGSNHAGGIEGGTSNGAPIVARAAFKPISTVPHALRSIDLATGEEAVGLHQRSDTCQVVPGAVIAEAEVALVLADALSDHAGGRSVTEMRRNLASYLAAVGERAWACPALANPRSGASSPGTWVSTTSIPMLSSSNAMAVRLRIFLQPTAKQPFA